MLLGARQFFERRGAPTPPLPYDAEVEYLEGDGFAYISCSYAPSRSATVVFDGLVGFASGSSGRRFLYADPNASITHYSEFNANNLFGAGGAYVQAQLSAGTMYSAKTTITASNYSAEISVGGVKYTSSTSGYASGNWTTIMLFQLTGTYRGSGQRLGRTKIIVNDEVIFDFIPVRKNGVGYMYDRANPTGGPTGDGFYANIGNGALLYGPDKS